MVKVIKSRVGDYWYRAACGWDVCMNDSYHQLCRARMEIAEVGGPEAGQPTDVSQIVLSVFAGFGHSCNFMQVDKSLHFSQPNNDLPTKTT